MYEVVKNTQYEALATRNCYLPGYRTMTRNPVCGLGRFHSTRNFSVQPDGSVVITFNNDDTNDHFIIPILMVKMTFHIDITRQHWWYNTYNTEQNNISGSKSPAFIISIGDIFKHYYKYNMNTINSTKILKKKKKGRNFQEDSDDINDENEDAYINKLVLKSLKINVNNTDVRAIIGSIETWKRHDMRLWDLLLDQGFLKTLGSDFTSFCNSFVILPMYHYDPTEDLSDCLSHISSFVLVKKLTKFFINGEDPSAKGYVEPKRDFFAAKSVVSVLEENGKDLIERYTQYRFDKIKVLLTRELNNKNKTEIEEKYTPPQTYADLNQVGANYPLHALRTIFISSWCANDFDFLETLVFSAKMIAKSDKTKHLINKRGKFQKYETYSADRLWRSDYDYRFERNNKFDIVHREISM